MMLYLIPGWRAAAALTLGYLISRRWRESGEIPDQGLFALRAQLRTRRPRSRH
jgi:hypothetical protein